MWKLYASQSGVIIKTVLTGSAPATTTTKQLSLQLLFVESLHSLSSPLLRKKDNVVQLANVRGKSSKIEDFGRNLWKSVKACIVSIIILFRTTPHPIRTSLYVTSPVHIPHFLVVYGSWKCTLIWKNSHFWSKHFGKTRNTFHIRRTDLFVNKLPASN